MLINDKINENCIIIGIGGLFRSLVRVISPVAKSIAKNSAPALKSLAKSKIVKQVGKDVVKTGVQSAVDSLNDIAEGRKPSTKKITQNFKSLGKKSLKRVSKNLADVIDETPQPRKKGKYVKKKYAKKKKKKSIYDE